MPSRRPLLSLSALALLLFVSEGASAQQSAQAAPERANASRSLQLDPAAGPIRVDAELDDEGWVDAERVEEFVEFVPREGAEPPVRTEVMLTYDDENLYVAFIGSDPNPDAIRATLQPRDRLWNDDWVGVLLDPYGDASLGYYFLSNAIGVQADMQMTTGQEDASIDFVYETAGRITDTGFVVEMAIPFRSLRVPDREVQDWGVMLVRTYPRSSRHYLTWPSRSRNNACQICQLASLRGIQNVRTGGKLEALPSLVVSRAGQLTAQSDPESFESGDIEAQPSLGLKYMIQPEWTVEGTFNPDFSQVESDAAQIDVNSTFALFYPERRPFFQEGMNLYQTPFSVFYSRSINAPQVAAKLTGRAGRTSIGYIGARDEHTPFVIPFEERTGIVAGGESFTNVLRVQQNLGGSHIGALVADRRMDGGGSGTTASADALYRFNEVYNMSGHLVLSHTQEPDDPALSAQLPDLTFGEDDEYTAAFDGESFSGLAGFVRFARDARTWSWNALYLDASPTYRSDAGFQTQNDVRRLTVWTGVTLYPNRPLLERVTASLFGGGFWNHDGVRKQAVIEPGINVTLPRQTQLGINTRFHSEFFRGIEMTGLRDFTFYLNSNFSDALRFGANLGAGRRIARTLAVPEVGTGADASIFATLTPIQQFVIEPSISYERLRLDDGEEVFAGYIARARLNYQFTRELQLRAVVQYNDFRGRLDVEPLLMYQINPFSIFYVGSTYGSSEFDGRGFVGTDRQYFAKFQYLLRK